MPIFDITQVSLEQAISGANMRQTVLAQNIAHANTPGYQRQDVDFHGALRAAMESGGPLERVRFAAQRAPLAVLRADGNGVDIDVESANLARNALEYEALVSVAAARVGILRTAMGTQ